MRQPRDVRQSGDARRVFRRSVPRPAILACLLATLLATLLAATQWNDARAGTGTVIAITAPVAPTAPLAPGATVQLTSAAISDSTGGDDQLLVTITAGSGTFSLRQTAGLTLVSGFGGFTDTNAVEFDGPPASVNAALASLFYTAPNTPASDTVTINVTSLADAGANPTVYIPRSGHYYEYVADSGVSWSSAQLAANTLTFDGAQGYLATLPTAAIQSFIDQHLNLNGVWAGGEAFDHQSGYDGDPNVQRVWTWASGQNQFPSDAGFEPDAGYYGGPLAGEIFTECTLLSGGCVFTNEPAWNGAGGDPSGWIQSAWAGTAPNNQPDNAGYDSGSPLTPFNGQHYLELNPGAVPGWYDLAPMDSGINGYLVEFGNSWGSSSSFPNANATATTNITVATVPAAPTDVSVDAASSAGGQATVSWAAPASDGGAPILGYTVTASPGAESCSTTAATSCTVSGLTDGGAYSFTVTARNAVGTSPASAAVTATPTATATPTPPPTPPAPPSVTVHYYAGVGATAGGSGVQITGRNFAPSTGVEVTMHSTPVGLGSASAGPSGGFSKRFRLPATVAPGIHHLEIAGSAPGGRRTILNVYFEVSNTGRMLRESARPSSHAPVWAPPSQGSPRAGGPLATGTTTPSPSPPPRSPGAASSPSAAGPGPTGSSPPTANPANPASPASPARPSKPPATTHAGVGRAARGAGSGGRTIGGVHYQAYDPRSPANARHTSDTVIALFTITGLLVFGGGLGLISGGFGGAALSLAPERESGEGTEPGAETRSGHGHGGNTLSSAKVKHLKFRHEAKARGDRSATWVSPFVERLDALSLALPASLNRFSPLAARLGADATYARAMAGTHALALPLAGLGLGIAAGVDIHAAAPPAFGLMAAIVVLAAFDASAGFLAAVAFSLAVILAGGIDGAAAVRTVLAIDVICFAGTLAASASRPLRRPPAADAAQWYDRGADLLVGTLIGMWAIAKMVGALSAIAGVAFPLTQRADALALIFGAAMLVRYLLESASAHWYPGRLAQVAAPKIGFPSARQQIASAVLKTFMFGFFAYAYIGWVWELYVGALLFLVPSIIAAYQGKLPNLASAVRWLPAGVIKVVLMLILGKLCATLLFDDVSSKTSFVELGFVLLGIPSLALGLFGFFAREGETFALNWAHRLGGLGLVALAVLIVQGVITVG